MVRKASLTTEDKIKLALSAISDRKGLDAVTLDVRDRTPMTDYFVIATGTSDVHIKAIVDRIVELFADKGMRNKRIEGYEEAVWVLLDYGDVIIHVFAPEQRRFYDLESFWTGREAITPHL